MYQNEPCYLDEDLKNQKLLLFNPPHYRGKADQTGTK